MGWNDPTLNKQTVMAGIFAPNLKEELIATAKPKWTKTQFYHQAEPFQGIRALYPFRILNLIETMKPKIVLQYNTNSKKLMGNVAVSKKHRIEVIYPHVGKKEKHKP